MKKNRMMRLASILLVCVLLTTSVISGTFAKYTSEATATDTARVAKWDIQLNGHQMQYTEEFEFDLFKTVLDSNGNTETDIYPANGSDQIVAPGTMGKFSIVLHNKSEVTAEYVIDYTVDSTSIPLVFSNDEGQTWKSIDNLDVTAPVTLAIGSEAKTVTIWWMWAFDGNQDQYDTTLGLDGTTTVTVTAKVTATQVN